MGCIYLARNAFNGKCYIGKTLKPFARRKAWHLAAANRGEGYCFHRAIRKHGAISFSWEILARSDDPDELAQMEIDLIAFWKTKRPEGYNLTDGGDGIRGICAESLARMAAFHRGRKRSELTRKRLSDAMKGKQSRAGAVLSEETKLKLSLANLGKRLTDEQKSKIGAAHKGKPKSDEQKRKMSIARSQWWAKRKATEEAES